MIAGSGGTVADLLPAQQSSQSKTVIQVGSRANQKQTSQLPTIRELMAMSTFLGINPKS
jgi:hypothetical protein